jgi:hypothetical protein
VAFYVCEHNSRLPHSAFRGQTPDEMYFVTGGKVPDELRSRPRELRQLNESTRHYAAAGGFIHAFMSATGVGANKLARTRAKKCRMS